MIGAAMDRHSANSNVRSGLFLAAFAIFVFALTFYAAVLYVG